MTSDTLSRQIEAALPDEAIQKWFAAMFAATNTHEYDDFRSNIVAALRAVQPEPSAEPVVGRGK